MDGQSQSIPLVSVVTASFNARAALTRTIESVAAQQGGLIEHVVVDGGSTDGTRELLGAGGGRLQWVSEPDEGIADALNKGVAMARGRYIHVLQAGDTYSSGDTLARLSPKLENGPDIASFAVRITGQGRNRVFASRGLGQALEHFMTVPHQGAFCSAALFERIGGFDPQYAVAMDYDFMLRAKRAGACCEVHDRVVALMPDDGISARLDWASLKERLGENRAIQARHARGLADRVRQAAFWSVYPLYKRFRAQG